MNEETIEISTLQSMLGEGEPVTVLDIRHTDDFQEWAIPGSHHVDAYDALKDKEPNALQGVEFPRDNPVVTVCGAGVVSKEAARLLREQGYQAFSLLLTRS